MFEIVFTFTLNYELTSDESGMDALVERLAEEGCGDALAGIGQPGRGLAGVGRSEGRKSSVLAHCNFWQRA